MFSKIVIIALFFILSIPVFAVSVTVVEKPSSISTDPFSLTVLVSGANAGKNYLRADLYKEGTTNYFGETYNGSEWCMGSVGTTYVPIEIPTSDASVSATFQARFGAPSSVEYSGPGTYKLRIRRYTSESNYTSSDPYDIAIDVPVATNTPTHTSKPTSTIAPTATPTKQSTNTPTKIPTSSPTVAPKESTQAPTDILEQEAGVEPTRIISHGVVDSSGVTQTQSTRPIIISLFLVGVGLALLAGGFVWKKNVGL